MPNICGKYRICTKCTSEIENSETYFNLKRISKISGKRILNCVCKTCENNKRRERYSIDIEYANKRKTMSKKYSLNNKDKCKDNCKNFHLNNPNYIKEYSKKQNLELSDRFIIGHIMRRSYYYDIKLKSNEISKELIDSTRELYKFQKTLKNENFIST